MEVNWNEIAGQVTAEVLRILIPVLAVLVLKWITEIWNQMKEKHPRIAELIKYAAELGYAAAEEYFRDEKASGDQKMAYAQYRAEEYLESVGAKVNVDVIRDAITEYGVNNFRFTWAQSPLVSIFKKDNEENHEPVNADDLCFGSDHDNNDADHNEAGEPAVRSGEGVEGEEVRERTPDDDQDGQAGRPDSADGETPA